MSDITRQKTIDYLYYLKTHYPKNLIIPEYIDFAISSLETDEAYQLEYESTTKNDLGIDVVSRKAVLNTLDSMDSALDEDRTVEKYKELLKECYKVLPSVKPIRPKGHWIEHEWEEMREKGYYRCSVCNHGYQRYAKGIRKSDVPYIDGQEYILWKCDNYCPNCGAKMVEPQERSDKA